MTFDWDAATAGVLTGDEVKARLPIMYVLEANGHFPAREEAGRYKYVSPFRPDNDPSFDVFVDGKTGAIRWGDFAEQKQGDVLDLVKRFMELTSSRKPSFGEVIEECRRYIQQMDESGWTAPTIKPRKTFDLEEAKRLYTAALESESTYILGELLSRRSDTLQSVDPDWLAGEFDLGEMPDRILVPYRNRDGELVAYKTRAPGGSMISAPGSGLYDHILYGEWRDLNLALPVILCEGESDTWAAQWQLGEDFIALGLPTGANLQLKGQPDGLKGRRVYLALDGDRTGRAAVSAWVVALQKNSCEVFIVPLPDGMDLAQCPDIASLIRRSRPPILVPSNAPQARRDGYYRPSERDNGKDEVLSNWTFEPERELQYESGTAYHGRIQPLDKAAVITSADLANKNALVRWSNRNGGSWYGTDRDAQLLLSVLQSAGVFLPAGRMTEVAGLHDGQYVWPGGQLGHESWSYVAPTTNVRLEKMLTLREGPWKLEHILALRAMHQTKVMDPILCWLAVAPLRSLVGAFPVLAVTGGSGSGKTTILETVLPLFSGSSITSNLTGTTGYAVGAFAGSTNAFPVWFDEFRPGARKDTLETFAQILRDAYTGQSSSKGGMNRNNVSEINTIDAIAPIVVSGEDSFTEQSHTERMVLVSLPKDGKNAEILAALQKLEVGPLAYAYLKWLQRSYIEDPDAGLSIVPSGPSELPSRVRYNLGVLKLGWDLLQQFFMAHGGILDGRPNLSLVGAEAIEAASTNPIRDALIWALEQSDDKDAGVFFLDTGEHVAVRVETFVAYIKKQGTFVLPGGAQAVRKYLLNNYGARQTTVNSGVATDVRALVLDHAALVG